VFESHQAELFPGSCRTVLYKTYLKLDNAVKALG